MVKRGEFAFIDWIRRQVSPNAQVVVGLGDDAAVLDLRKGRRCLVTTDMLLEGCHFKMSEVGPKAVGRKAMAVNLSDIAAMAGIPVAAVVSLGLPRSAAWGLAEKIYSGLREMADIFETQIVGGDTNCWDGPLVINVALLGEETARGPVRRAGAECGDWLFVTGPLGGSLKGKHLTFKPRVREALKLHAAVNLKAMIDISDGLSADLDHICEESGCGAVLYEAMIPISQAAREIGDSLSALEHALGDGEDFELLFAVSPSEGQKLLREQPVEDMGVVVTRVGECVKGGLWLEDAEGKRRELEPKGYVHEMQ